MVAGCKKDDDGKAAGIWMAICGQDSYNMEGDMNRFKVKKL